MSHPERQGHLFKIKFERCTDCHADKHAGQFAAAPYFNACDRCHNLEGYRPSTFSSGQAQADALRAYRRTRRGAMRGLSQGIGRVPAEACCDLSLEESELHELPHTIRTKGNSKSACSKCGRMVSAAGCEACHTTKSWKELSGFDHSKTKFPLLGRASRHGLHRLPQAAQP